MRNNEVYYMQQVQYALDAASAELSEGGADYNHVIIDALQNLEGAVKQGFKPWEAYNEPVKCYRVSIVGGQHSDVWAEDLFKAHEQFLKDFPSAVVVSVVLQH